MSEDYPLSYLGIHTEAALPSNPFNHAITENQRILREAKHNLLQMQEMPKVSTTIEHNMKRVFSEHIDPTYPRVIVARTVALTSIAEGTKQFAHYELAYDYPEHATEEDQIAHARGSYDLNEWATNYATRYYFEHTSNNPLTKQVRRVYSQVGDALLGKAAAPQTYQTMAEVKKTAVKNGNDFDHAVFEALFQHDFALLNALIAQTENIPAVTVDELAIRLGKAKLGLSEEAVSSKGFLHLIEVTSNAVANATQSEKTKDTLLSRSLKTVGQSLFVGGACNFPGIVEIGIGGQIAYPLASSLTGAGLDALLHGDALVTGIAAGGVVAGFTSAILPYVTIHESIHGYSATEDHIGLFRAQLYSPLGADTGKS